ncbi:Acetyltransferase (GNAT) family protein [Actinopolymorpha cephalotaxi]|uniref:Acetyltransferase (GNAT) family protein n=1 Tax=Actinopolymorpha cephalotaxi TaxID=504797 RepID=A0A1I2XUM5_9ACTN|nr:Acetyltransferase (GNAT) family protein [Actinopolymorpha cephalotaxi]
MTLWQVRTRVRDIPGKLAQLATALGAVRGNVVGIDVHGCDLEHVHDDLFVDVPETIGADRLAQVLAGADGTDVMDGQGGPDSAEPVRLRRARAQELVDGPSQALTLAARLVEDPAALPGLLCRLVGADSAEDAELCGQPLPDSPHHLVVGRPGRRGHVIVHREWAPFTWIERARVDRLVDVAAAMARRQADAVDRMVLPDGSRLRIRLGGPEDAGHVADLLARCSRSAREARFVADDGERLPARWLDRLAAPPEGFSLLAFAESGELVGMAQCLPQDQTLGRARVHEVGLLVEDGWQRRGIGTLLVRGLARRALADGVTELVAVGTAAQTGRAGTERLFARAGLPVLTRYADGVWEARARLRSNDRDEPVSAGDLHSAVLRGEAAVRAWARSTAR